MVKHEMYVANDYGMDLTVSDLANFLGDLPRAVPDDARVTYVPGDINCSSHFRVAWVTR